MRTGYTWSVLLAVALITSACASGGVRRWPSGPLRAGTQVVPTVVSLPGPCLDVAFSDGVVWVLGGGDGLYRIDPDTNRVTETIPAPTSKGARGPFAVQGDSVWVSSGAPLVGQEVLRIDTRTKQVVARIPGLAGELAIGEGAVWVTNRRAGGDSVVRIDPGTNTVVTTIGVGKSPSAVAAGAGSIWVSHSDGSIIRIDPQTNRVVTKTQVGEAGSPYARPSVIGVGAGAVWVAMATGGYGRVLRVDPVTNSVVANISLSRGDDIAFRMRVLEDGVWVASRVATGFYTAVAQVVRIDPATNQVVWEIHGPSLVATIPTLAVGASTAWTCR
jgi:YVTN family beta-propeller protein